MNGAIRSTLLYVLFVALLSGASAARERSSIRGDDWFDLWFEFSVRKGDSVEKLRTKLRRIHVTVDFDGGGVSAADVLIQEQEEAAKLRAQQLQGWMHQDLNGDGKVNRHELQRYFARKAKRFDLDAPDLMVSPAKRARSLNSYIRQALKFDSNDDGVVELDEALDWVKKNPNRIRESKLRVSYAVPMSLDKNADGLVSIDEFDAAVDAAIARWDQDVNGEFSSEEIAAVSRSVGKRRHAMRTEVNARERAKHSRLYKDRCGFPKAPEDARVILLGAHRGQALSTVALGDDDEVISVANIVIEPGSKKLYVAITSHDGIIWRVTGAVDRLAHLVVTARTLDIDSVPRVGVIGVPADRVHIPPRERCIGDFTDPTTKRGRNITKALKRFIGREADSVVADETMNTIRLPSMSFDGSVAYPDAIDLPETGPGAPMWKKMLSFNPGGLVRIDPKVIVSRTTAKPYVTLPREAGLAQLLESGALEPLSTSQQENSIAKESVPSNTREPVANGKKTRRARKPPHSRFLVVNGMRFPTGLTGEHLVEFVLKEGVPGPSGWPGHSRVVAGTR